MSDHYKIISDALKQAKLELQSGPTVEMINNAEVSLKILAAFNAARAEMDGVDIETYLDSCNPLDDFVIIEKPFS